MTHTSSYRELNLNEGASLSEIKSAFRQMAKNCHPDAAGPASDSDKFRRAYLAYRDLLKSTPSPKEDNRYQAFHFSGKRTVGLDIYYDIEMIHPETHNTFSIQLPWTAHEACPRCLGQGQTLSRIGHNDIYRPHTCPRCQGKGHITRKSQITVNITPEMAARGKLRLRQAGAYLPGEALRGDLIICIKWVNRLPQSH